jgi:hypothetical protein
MIIKLISMGEMAGKYKKFYRELNADPHWAKSGSGRLGMLRRQ